MTAVETMVILLQKTKTSVSHRGGRKEEGGEQENSERRGKEREKREEVEWRGEGTGEIGLGLAYAERIWKEMKGFVAVDIG